ncbi:MAG: AAA family ATPase [Clostridia bacterium]|nr:AAA family ATPase [Clostridia bacterium]MDH7572905.1 AAA family ATPase [Clostridia bacterium]
MTRLNLLYGGRAPSAQEGGRNPAGGAPALEPANGQRRVRREPEALAELDRLVGLARVKELVREIYAYLEVGRWRSRENLTTVPTVLHMVFRGNPGTGKTTVARLLGRLFRDLGVLSRGHLVEVERADLVGQYVGHTAQKTREQIKKALGGILFVDEAYSLARGGEKDFGREAIDTLVRATELHRNEFVLILAGYHAEMERFLRTNPGLCSRLPLELVFPDYNVSELLEIARYMLSERDYRLSPAAEALLERHLRQLVLTGQAAQGNARLVRNLLEKAMRRQALRLLNQGQATREELMSLEPADFGPLLCSLAPPQEVQA